MHRHVRARLLGSVEGNDLNAEYNVADVQLSLGGREIKGAMVARPVYSSPSRRQTSREALARAAMAMPGRFRPDGCWREIITNKEGAKVGAATFVQMNRRWRRSGGRSS